MSVVFKYSARCLFLLMAVIGTSPWLLEATDDSQNQSKRGVNLVDDRVQQLLTDEQTDDDEAAAAIFELDKKALPALIVALREGKNVTRVARGLAYVGGPEERQTLLRTIEGEKDSERRSVLSAILAGALVEPASKEEWAFLKKSIEAHKDEQSGGAFVSFSAALALGMNGSQSALRLLERGESNANSDSAKTIADAIRWIKHRPISKEIPSSGTESDSDKIEKTVLRSAFYAEREAHQPSVDRVVFTEDRRRALATVQIYHGPKDAQSYNIVLQKSAGAWRIVGIWFTWAA